MNATTYRGVVKGGAIVLTPPGTIPEGTEVLVTPVVPDGCWSTLMDETTWHALVQQLGKEMSDISEDCYCAGWLGGTEYMVPELCRRAVESGQTQYWGFGEITPSQACQIWELAKRIGCWADSDAASIAYIPFQPFPIPPEYLDAIEREQSFGGHSDSS